MGGIMMIYAFSLLWVQLPLFIGSFILLIILVRDLKNPEYRKEVIGSKKILIISFTATTFIALSLLFFG